MAKRLTKLTVKASILAGAIYATADQGIWKDTDSADETWNILYRNVCPYFKELPVEMPKIPSTSCIAKATREYYNKGVITSVKFLQELPGQLSHWTSQGTNYLSDTISSISYSSPEPDSAKKM